MSGEQSVSSKLPDGSLMEVAEKVGRQWGMSGSQLIQHIAIGDIPHPDAAFEECGMTDPRDDGKWCRRVLGHSGDHNWYMVGQ